MNKKNVRQNKEKGITLIALVITIIVMLILVGVTISMSVNGGLFDQAGKATGQTKNAVTAEEKLADGGIEVDGVKYNTVEDYINKKPSTGESLPTYTNAKKENGYLAENATYESGTYTAVIPKGFKIIEGLNGKTTIADGLVIQDANGNEFVWIPVEKDLGSSYSSGTNYNEPKELTEVDFWDSQLTYDSQAILDYYYGANYYTYTEDFKYAEEYAEMVEKVNKYNGFYIGRYETTIDSDGNIGSKYNTEVLTGGTTLFTKSSTNYPYRWYGLYYAQKNAEVAGNGTDVQTAMIYGVLYDQAMQFIRDQKKAGNTTYNVDEYTESWHSDTAVVNSAQANAGDVALNIWDLESNAFEWTQEADTPECRVGRGGYYSSIGGLVEASGRGSYCPTGSSYAYNSSRLALYIK